MTVFISIIMEYATTDLFSAIRNGDLEKVKKIILVYPEFVNSRDDRESTPLLLATYYGQEDIADLLLEQGAEFDAADASGNTALMGVCFKGYTKIANKLIENGANINHRNSTGSTCLIYAVTFNKVEITKLLLTHGADTSIQDASGDTALDHARIQGNPTLINLLEID